jgi:flagellar hook-associated protein 1 FlgK
VATAAGASTNELEDQRDTIIDNLSGLVGIDVTEGDNNQYNITIDGARLVSGDDANQLECYTIADTASEAYGMYGIRWSDTGTEFNTGDSGSLNGYLEIRDGNSEDSKGIPYYTSQLDQFARTFAQAFNEGVTVGTTTYSGHADGVGLNDTTGIRFFSYDNKSSAELMASGSDVDAVYKNITAANITVSKDIQEDTDKIAASSTSGEEANTDNLDSLISICEDVNVTGNCTVSDLYKVSVEDVAGTSAAAQNAYDRQDSRTTYINTSRSSVSAVSDNEETLNMTTYESAYAASAKMVNAWSQLYETTINMVDD